MPHWSRVLLGHVAVVCTVARDILARVSVIPTPSRLAVTKRASVGVDLSCSVEDGVDCALRATVADSDHNRVLIGTHDVCDVTKHNFLFVVELL